MTPSGAVTSFSNIGSRSELVSKQFQALCQATRVLGRAKTIEETLSGILAVIHNECGMLHGIVTLCDPEHAVMTVGALHSDNDFVTKASASVRYQPGEGILGRVLQQNEAMVLAKISSEPRFLDRLELYDLKLPFIGVPIRNENGDAIGVLAAQPNVPADDYLPERTSFMTAIADLLSQSVRLIVNVEKGQNLVSERDELRREVRNKYGFENMVVGHTEGMRRVFDQVRRVAKWDSTVLVLGESGTGKELIASAIHYNSPRAHKRFVKLNCASVPETLLESELFGHEKGAFTGAVKQRKGRFEQADGGTLFLDEIGEISAMFQAKLLRVLQEGELERVGGGQTISVDVRIVAATNRNLELEVEQGNFREDLYYRLNVMPIRLPPLRDRMADVPELSEFLLGKIAKEQKRPLKLRDDALRVLMGYDWPGNVRELENTLERAAVMSEDGTIDASAITLTKEASRPREGVATLATSTTSHIDLNNSDLSERDKVIAALEQTGWVQAKAARLLGMTPRQIAYRIQTLEIDVKRL